MIKAVPDKKLEGQTAFWFIALCTVVYFTSYVTRINYGAVITEVIRAEGIGRSEAGLVSTVAFLTYGAGQVLTGYIGDKISPKIMIIAGLLATSACNILLPFAPTPIAMAVIWGINGIFQAFFWPPLTKIMATMLDMDNYKKACVAVSVGSSFGTIAVYLLAPIVITLSGWRPMFYLCAGCAVLIAMVWTLVSPSCPVSAPAPKMETDAPAQKSGISASVVVLIAMIAVGITLQGILRDGLTTWMPTFVADTFDFSSAASILTGIILPIFSVISFNVAAMVEKKIKNELKTATVIFGLGAVAAGLLIFLQWSAPAAIALMALITGCMHGVNLMLISQVPPYFNKFGRISFVSGLFNAFTYLGSGISGFGIAILSENLGWGATVVSWFIVAALGTVLCALCIGKWSKFIKE